MIRNKLLLLISFLLVLTTGCSYDENFLPENVNSGNLKVLIPSAILARHTGVTRGNDISTRACTSTADLISGEGIITKLYLAAFYTPENSSDRKHLFYELTSDMGEVVDGVYRSFSFNVEPGRYQLYVVANMDLSADLIRNLENDSYDSTALENDIKKLQKEYNSSIPLPSPAEEGAATSPGLPMTGEKTVDVGSNSSTDAVINLQFLCAKVRLTIIHETSLGVVGLRVNKLAAQNLYSPMNYFSNGPSNEESEKFNLDIDIPIKKGHYELGEAAGKSVSQLASIYSSLSEDPLEHLGAEIEDFSTCTENAYQAVVYLPESKVIENIEDATSLVANMCYEPNGTGTKVIKFPIGCNGNSTSHNENEVDAGSQLKRGNFYDIVAKIVGGDVQVAFSVMNWTPDELTMELAGNSSLYVSQTVVDKVSGSDLTKIAYNTDAPSLSFESATVSVNGKDVPVFSLRENKEEGVIEVALGSGVSLGKEIPEDKMYFWVKAGTIRKQIKVREVDTEAFVRITPADRNLYIAHIINEKQYPLWFEYSTNMDELSINLKTYVNNNSRNVDHLSVQVYTGTEDEPLAYSIEEQPSVSKSISGMIRKEGVTEDASKSGLICIMVKNPADASYFAEAISGSFEAVGKATGVSDIKATATFAINPNPSKYIVHFKAINSKDSSYKWSAPHCYVYQPLTYYYEGSDASLSGAEYIVLGSSDNTYNWLEYSFTGKLVFKGWAPYGEVKTLDEAPTKDLFQKGNKVTAYSVWGDANSTPADKYFDNIDLIPDFRKKIIYGDATHVPCESCRGSGDCDPRWPGISMYKDDKNEGWWIIELPALAQPGLALLMFADGHSYVNDSQNRYPGKDIPGIPLPDFASKEAWLLYDKSNEKKVAFSDEKRESYDDDVTIVDRNTITVTFRAPYNADSNIKDYLCVWGPSTDNDNKNIIGENSSNKLVKYSGSKRGYRYWTTEIKVDGTNNPSTYVSGFRFGSSSSSTSGSSIAWSGHYKEETDSETKKLFGNTTRLYTIWPGSSEPVLPHYVLFCWGADWTNSSHLYMWKDSNNPLGSWPGTAGTKDNANSKYWIYVKTSSFSQGEAPSLTSGYKYIFNLDKTNQGGDMDLNSTNAEEITSVPTDIRDKVGGPIDKIFNFKKRH